MDSDAGTSDTIIPPPDPFDRAGSFAVRKQLARLLIENVDRIAAAVGTQNLGGCPFCQSVQPRARDQVVREAVFAYAQLLETGSREGLLALASHATSMQAPIHWTVAELQHILGSLNRPLLPLAMEAFASDLTTQRQAIDLLLACADLGSIFVSHHLEQSLQHEKKAAEERKMEFYREVTQLATNNRLRLVDSHDEVPEPRGEKVPLDDARDAARLRYAATSAADSIGMEQERTKDLALAVGEAAANVIAHAGNGHGAVWTDRNTVFVYVRDRGQGIRLDDLPKATLAPGWSSEPSLGMGFTLMLEMSDVVWLATDDEGTTVCIEKAAWPDPMDGLSFYLQEKIL